MPFPKGLKFKHRLADDANGFYFDCYREAEHPATRPRFRESFETKGERDVYITRHDAKYHDRLLAQELGLQKDVPLVGEIVAAYVASLERRWRDGQGTDTTLEWYRKLARQILRVIPPTTPSNQVTTETIRAYERVRRRDGATKGAMIRKEVSALRTMYLDYGVAPLWVLRRNAITVTRYPKQKIGVDKIVRFIAAMERGSLESDFCEFKFSTGLHNREIYALDVRDGRRALKSKDRALEYGLLKKAGGVVEPHLTYLNDVALAIVRRRVGDRPGDEPLFELDGRRLGQSSLRKRFQAASRAATIAWRAENKRAPEIRIHNVGQFRHEVASEVAHRLKDIEVVRGQLGHRSERTTRRYVLSDRAQTVAKSKAFTKAAGKALRRKSQ